MAEVLPPLPAGAEPISAPPLPAGAQPISDFRPPVGGVPRAIGAPSYPEEDLQPTARERMSEVGKAGGLGAALGFATPEIMKYLGRGMQAVPRIAPYAGAVQAMGEASRGIGPRMGQAIYGGIGGLTGEAAGQYAESEGLSKWISEPVRFAGGVSGQLAAEGAARFLGNRVTGPLFSAVLNKIAPGSGTFGRTLGQMGEPEAATAAATGLTLNQRQSEFIRQKLLSIRGRERDPVVIERTEREIYGFLRQVADDALRSADAQARTSFNQADQLLRDAESATGQMRDALVQRLSSFQSQFEANAMRLEKTGQDAVSLINEQANQAIKNIIERAKQQGPEMQQAAKAEADAIKQRAADDVKKLTDILNAKMTRMREVRDRLRQTSGQRAAESKREIGAVGEQLTPTTLGSRIREGFTKKIEQLKQVRDTNVKKYKDAAFAEALTKEKAGQKYQDTPQFKEAIDSIGNELRNAETGLLNVPPEQMKALTSVRDLLRRGVGREDPQTGEMIYTQLSFNALENLRRQLRDRSFGLPAEGYDAINQQQAGRLAQRVENIMEGFSPGFRKYLDQYKADSQPLNEFKNRLGKAVSDVAEFDMGQFVTDAAELGTKAFRTATTVDQVIKTLGQDEAERLARSFLADKMRGKSAQDVAKALDQSRDWIGRFPALQRELEQVAQRAGVSESTVARRQKLAEGLQTKIGKTATELAEQSAALPAEAAKKATTVEEKAAEEAAKVLPEAEKTAAGLKKGAAAEAAAKEAEIRKQIEASARSVEKQKTKVGEEVEKKIAETTQAAEAGAKQLRGAGEEALAAGKAQEQLLVGKDVKDVARLKQIIENAGKPQFAAELKAVGQAIRSSPEVRQKFENAVIEHIAANFQRSPKGGVDAAETLFKNLRDEGLISPQKEKEVLEKLREVAVMPADLKTRLSVLRTLGRGLIMSGGRVSATAALPSFPQSEE